MTLIRRNTTIMTKLMMPMLSFKIQTNEITRHCCEKTGEREESLLNSNYQMCIAISLAER